jgi:hypothetical protein
MQTCMSRVGYEPTTQVFERAKPIHTLDRTATVVAIVLSYRCRKYLNIVTTLIKFTCYNSFAVG